MAEPREIRRTILEKLRFPIFSRARSIRGGTFVHFFFFLSLSPSSLSNPRRHFSQCFSVQKETKVRLETERQGESERGRRTKAVCVYHTRPAVSRIGFEKISKNCSFPVLFLFSLSLSLSLSVCLSSYLVFLLFFSFLSPFFFFLFNLSS